MFVAILTNFDKNKEEDFAKIQNIDQFQASVKDFVENNPDATLSSYLESITLISDIDSVEDNEDCILISTVHAVKGLEFKAVFVVALENGIFPIIRTGDRPSNMEEERRLMYVAVTRAKERLYLTMSKQRYLYNQKKDEEMSQFLKEMGYEEQNKFSGWNYSTMRSYEDDNYYSPARVENATNIQQMFNKKIETQQKDLSEFRSGVKVLHPKFGAGVIIDDRSLKDNHMVTINFDIVGNKTLSLDYAPLQILKK